MALGEIRISAPGNRVSFTRVPKQNVEGVDQVIRDRVALATNPATSPVQSQSSVAEEIEKLAGIRDKGLLH
jgi:hypothetical protein